MVSEEQIRHELINIYEDYLSNKEDKKNREKAYSIYTKYFNGADTLFKENVCIAIWESFNLYEGKLKKDRANKILEELRKKE